MAVLKRDSTPTPLRDIGHVGRHRRVMVKDESVQPTGTFKDRLSAAAVARQTPDRVYGSISYGNTALSFARALKGSPRSAFVGFFPMGFRAWTFGPSSTGRTVTGQDVADAIVSDGGEVIEIDLSSKVFGDADLEAIAVGSGLAAHRSFVNVTEGLDEPAYAAIASESLEQMGDAPDVCIVQYGAGILANEVLDVMARASPKTIVVPISSPYPDTLAKMLYGPIWLDVHALSIRGVAVSRQRSPDRTGASRPPYRVYMVSDEQVRRGLAVAASINLSAEPSGSAGLGFLHNLEAVVPSYDPARHTVLVINTGNGIDPLANRKVGS